MSNLKKQLYDRETNQNISPITDTEAVFTPDGRTAEQRNTEQMAKLESELSGRGSYARASVYPTLNLGIFSTMEEANAKLDEIYTTSETKYHGKLRLSVNGTTMWIEQYQVNYQQRYWMQIVYGPFAKNANGTALVQDFGKAHITYRVKNGVADIPWSDYQIEGLNLATINGQSLTEGGDIVVTEQGVLPIDDHLDVSSENAVSNCIIALAFERLEMMIEGMGLKTDLIKIAEITREAIITEEEQYMGSDGEIILSLSGYEEPTDDPIVILRVPDGSSYKYYSQWDASPYYKADEDINVNEDYFVIYDNSKVEILHYNTTTGRIVSTYIENQSISPIVQATYWCTSSELGTINDGDFWYDTTSGKLKKCRDASEGYWEEFGVGVLLVNNPNDNKVYEVDNTRPGIISRFLDEGDLQDINARIDNIDVEKNKEIYYVKYWGSDTTSQEYRGLNIGDCWYDPSEHAIKIKIGADTFTTVTPEVALLYDVLAEEFYIYTQDGVSVYERLLTTKDLNTGGIITSRINERVTASEKKYLGSVYEVKWWQNTQPSNPTVGDHWYNTDSKELYIVDSVSPYRITKINTSTRGSILMRRLDGDDTYNGRVYELDFRWQEMRLLDENDLSDIIGRINATNARIDNITGEGDKGIYFVKFWQDTAPSASVHIGDYWYDTDDAELNICTATNPITFDTIDTDNKAFLLYNDVDGLVYEYINGEEATVRFLTTTDLNGNNGINKKIENLKNQYSAVITPKCWRDSSKGVSWSEGDYWYNPDNNTLKEYKVSSGGFITVNRGAMILCNPQNSKLYKYTSDESRLLDEEDLVVIEAAMVPISAIVQNVAIQSSTLVRISASDNCDLVYDSSVSKLLLKVYSSGISTAKYYQSWTVSDILIKGTYYLQPSEYYYNGTALKGFYYLADNTSLTLYHWGDSGGLVSTKSVLTKSSTGSSITIDGQKVQFAKINGQSIVESGDITIQGGGVSNLKTINNISLVGDGNIEVAPAEENLAINNPLYPEYYLTSGDKLTLKYAPDYHKWPLLWYGGEVSGVYDTAQANASGVEVFAPGECMYDPHFLVEAYVNNWNVVWDTAASKFLLRIGTGNTTVYYKDWDNRYLYCDSNGTPHKGVIYVKYLGRGHESWNNLDKGSDNSSIWESTKYRPETQIWNGNTWIDPFEYLTDFRQACQDCLNANKGNMQLRAGKMYYCEALPSDHEHSYPLLSVGKVKVNNTYIYENDFVINGNGGGLLVRTPITGILEGGTGEGIFYFDVANHATICNLTVASLRDNMNGGPSGLRGTIALDAPVINVTTSTAISGRSEPRFCCTSSNLSFIHIGNSCTDIRIENIETYGMDHDIDIKNHNNSSSTLTNKNIILQNIKGVLTNGNTVRDVDGIVFDNYDMLQDGYANGGNHVVYFQGNTGVVYFRNCKIRASAPYRQLMFSWSPGQATNNDTLQELVFEGCDITGNRIIGTPYPGQRLRIVNSTIRVTRNESAGITYALTEGMTPIATGNGQLEIVNSHIISPVKCISVGTALYAKIVISGSTFVRSRLSGTDSLNTGQFIFASSGDGLFKGHYKLIDTKVYYEAATGYKRDAYPDSDYVAPVRVPTNEIRNWLGLVAGIDDTPETIISDIDAVLNGVRIETLDKSPVNNPDVDYRWYDSTNDLIKYCAVKGEAPVFKFEIDSDFSNSKYYYGRTTVTLLTGESFTFNLGNAPTGSSETERYSNATYKSLDAILSNIDTTLKAYGVDYRKVTDDSIPTNIHSYWISQVGNNCYLYIRAKTAVHIDSNPIIDTGTSNTQSRCVINGVVGDGTFLTFDSVIFSGTDPTWRSFERKKLIDRLMSVCGVEAAALPTTEPSYSTVKVNDMWHDTEHSAVYKCVEGPKPAVVWVTLLRSSDYWPNGIKYTGKVKIHIIYNTTDGIGQPLHDSEVITIPKNGTYTVTNKTEAIKVITDAFMSQGYILASSREAVVNKTMPGQFYVELTSSNGYIYFSPKRKEAYGGLEIDKSEAYVTGSNTPTYTSFVNAFNYSYTKNVVSPVYKQVPYVNSKINILHIGNSYTQNTHEHMALLLENLGVNNVNIQYLPISAATLQSTVNDLVNDVHRTVYTVGSDTTTISTLSDILANAWDIVIFQQKSSDAGTYSTYNPYLAKLIETTKHLVTKPGVKIGFEMIWESSSTTAATPFSTSFADIVATTKSMMEDYNIDILIPVGTAVENARASSMNVNANNFSKDAAPDKWHLGNGVGCYVAACAFYCAVIEPLVNVSIYKDTTTIIHTGEGTGEKDVVHPNRALCQKCAAYAKVRPYVVDEYIEE